ncbi:MAG: hypothetical protein HY096_11070 [Nitrospinae bacterium]|nr:hypothetical protein [Nitrospinota bacterium]
MNTISYIPSKDELFVKFRPVTKRPSKEIGRFKLWWDREGNICAIYIKDFTIELEEFKKNLNMARLSGIWKDIKITDKEIKEGRKKLLKQLEEKW